MVPSIPEIGSVVCGMATVSNNGSMVHAMRDSGVMTRLMVTEDSNMAMGTYTKAAGRQTKPMEAACIDMLMAPSMMDNGRTTSRMVKVSRSGRMAQDTRVSIRMVARMELVISLGPMARVMMVSLRRTISQESECTGGEMAVHSRASGRAIVCMARVSSLGAMVEHTREIITMTRKKAKVFLDGPTAGSMKADGKMASNMALAHIQLQRAKGEVANGKMVDEHAG